MSHVFICGIGKLPYHPNVLWPVYAIVGYSKKNDSIALMDDLEPQAVRHDSDSGGNGDDVDVKEDIDAATMSDNEDNWSDVGDLDENASNGQDVLGHVMEQVKQEDAAGAIRNDTKVVKRQDDNAYISEWLACLAF